MMLVNLIGELQVLGVHLVATSDGNLKIKASKGALTLQLQQSIKAHKAELLSILTDCNLPDDQVPESFRMKPCRRCGGHEARVRADGRILCPCYWQAPEVQSRAS